MNTPKYLVFTNIWNGYRQYMMSNNFKTFEANTIEEVREIIDEVASKGYRVTKVTTNLGYKVAI